MGHLVFIILTLLAWNSWPKKSGSWFQLFPHTQIGLGTNSLINFSIVQGPWRKHRKIRLPFPIERVLKQQATFGERGKLSLWEKTPLGITSPVLFLLQLFLGRSPAQAARQTLSQTMQEHLMCEQTGINIHPSQERVQILSWFCRPERA